MLLLAAGGERALARPRNVVLQLSPCLRRRDTLLFADTRLQRREAQRRDPRLGVSAGHADTA